MTIPSAKQSAGMTLRISLWVAQVLLTAVYVPSGLTKLLSPIPSMASQIAWADDVPESFLRFIGCVDLAGGIGVLLPALLRIAPQLTPLAALGCSVLQMLAIGFHTYRGELDSLPLNAVLLSLSLFVLWGRTVKVPVTAVRTSH